MNRSAPALLAALLAASIGSPGAAQSPVQTEPTPAPLMEASKLEPAVRSDLVFNGVTTTPTGRVFLSFPRQDKGRGMEVGELAAGRPRPFPDAAWNGWAPGRDARSAFVWANAVRVGPDGALWVVDAGAPGMGRPRVAGGPKLVQIDLQTNSVRRIYPLEAATGLGSYVDDVRFNGTRAYLTDAGTPGGLIVLDLGSGQARRVLDKDASVTAQLPLTGAGGRHLVDGRGQPVVANAEQLEVSPDGMWLYYQPCTGPLYRIETRYLDDPATTNAELSSHVEVFARTGATGGTAMDAAGNLYVSQVERSAVVRITPQGEVATLVQDPRLDWVDAMWIDDQGRLWLPAAQLDRTKGMNGGTSTVKLPAWVYTLDIGQAPERR